MQHNKPKRLQPHPRSITPLMTLSQDMTCDYSTTLQLTATSYQYLPIF